MGVQLAKVDIKRAYRNIPVHPEDRWMLGDGMGAFSSTHSFWVHFQIDVMAVHVPGAKNDLADAVSRDNQHTLFLQVPDAVGRRETIPTYVLSLLVEHWTSQDWSRLLSSCFL